MSEVKESDYLANIEIHHVSGDVTADDLKNAIQLGGSNNAIANNFMHYIDSGFISRDGALAFIGKLFSIEESLTNKLVDNFGGL